MTQHWWKDFHDRDDRWQGLALHAAASPSAATTLEMRSGHHGRMALYLQDEPLFWATTLLDHSGVWLVFNADHKHQHNLLPPITSQDIEHLCRKAPHDREREWCRYFARRLTDTGHPLLPGQRCLLRPMLPAKPTAAHANSPRQAITDWRFQSPDSRGNLAFNWRLYGEDFPDLRQPEYVTFVDWWFGGDQLLPRYAIEPDSGRLKWWRKKCREGTLPPILVWHVAGLASFVILDGHYRLQAAIEEQIAPQFVVLSELSERVIAPTAAHEAKITQALEAQLRKNPHGKIDGINQTLIDLYDTRYHYASTHSRAVLGNGDAWARQVSTYLRHHQADALLDKILARLE